MQTQTQIVKTQIVIIPENALPLICGPFSVYPVRDQLKGKENQLT